MKINLRLIKMRFLYWLSITVFLSRSIVPSIRNVITTVTNVQMWSFLQSISCQYLMTGFALNTSISKQLYFNLDCVFFVNIFVEIKGPFNRILVTRFVYLSHLCYNGFNTYIKPFHRHFFPIHDPKFKT